MAPDPSEPKNSSSFQATELPGRLAGLSVWRQVLVLAIWPLLEQLLGFLVGFVDTAIAGRLSVQATESIAVAAYIGWLMVLMYGAVGIGAAALVSRAIGARHRRLANKALGQAIVFGLIVGLFLTAFLLLTADLIPASMNLSDESIQMAATYLRVLAIAAPASGILFVSNACLRASGDTKTPFRILAVVNLVNVACSLLFVFASKPWGGHGVHGIAAGTAIAWCVGSILAIRAIRSGNSPIRLRWARLQPEPKTMRRILRISAPQFLDSLTMWTGNFLIASIVGYIGRTSEPGALGAHVIVVRIEAISYLPGWALAVAAATLTGQYLGLGNVPRAKQATSYCLLIAAITMGTMGLIFMLAPYQLVRLVTSEPDLLKIAPPILRICGPAQIFLGTAMVFDQALRGAGDTRMATLIVAGSTMLIRLPAAYLVGVVYGQGIMGIWIAICAEIGFRAILVTVYYKSGRWTRVRV
ncbi:MAG: MATE family efflux transporter [Planctomycetaceae bacterium]|nr:MATE family efflux transporter [Planctomycetaceae bacterium]